MEKPRKMICGTCNGTKRHKDVFGDVIACPHCHLVHQRNETIDAMSTWLEGEVKEIQELVNDYVADVESGIKYLEARNQDYGYGKDRLRTKAKSIQILLTRKLTGKV